MQKFFALFFGLILLPLTAQAIEYKEGTHYRVIKQTASATPVVTEFFSFYCGHCRAFEPYIAEMEASLAEGVEFKKNHVDFLGREMGPLLTNAYAAAQILQVEDQVAALLFTQIQEERKPVNKEQGILAIFEQAGITQQEAQSALQSFPVVGRASQMKRETEKFAIRGVPTVIVNDKYQVNRAALKSAEEFIDLVNYLTQKQD